MDRRILRGFEIDEGRAEEAHDFPIATVEHRDAFDGLPWGRADLVVMNPPFSLALPFVERAIAEVRATAARPASGGGQVVALLRLGMLEGKKRAAFWREHPADVYVLSSRPSFTGRGTDASAYAWFRWPALSGRLGTVSILSKEG